MGIVFVLQQEIAQVSGAGFDVLCGIVRVGVQVGRRAGHELH